MTSVNELKKGDILTNTNHGFDIEIVEIGKQEIINGILESGAKYVKTSVSNESCAVAIAIRDIEDSAYLPSDFEWTECSTGLDEEDY